MKRVIALLLILSVIGVFASACYPVVQQQTPQELAGPVRDWNVPGTLTAGTIVARSAVNLPNGSVAWQDIANTNMPVTLLPENPWDADVVISGTLGVSDTVSIWSNLVFEGATANAFETTFAVTDPTADRTVIYPNAGGTVVLSTLSTNAPDAANSVTGASNGWVFEGATANDFETTIAPTDPTADQTITLPNASGIAELTTDVVLAKIANYAVAATDTGAVIKASGNITLTLPAAAAGLNFCIVNYDGGDLTLDVTDTADVFLNEVNSPGDRVTNTTAYDNICVVAIDAVNYVTISSLGTWADGN